MNLNDFSRALGKTVNVPLLERKDLFGELCAELDVQALLVDEIRQWLIQPRRSPPIVSDNTVRLGQFGSLVLDITVIRENRVPQTISSHQDILQSFCGNCFFDLFEILTEHGMPVALKRSDSGSVNDGDLFAIDGSQQVFVAYSSEPVWFLSLTEFEAAGVRHKFDSNSLKQIGMFAANPALTATQLAARFLGYYGDESCRSALHHLLNSPIGAIKWEAACALASIDRTDGIAAMKILSTSVDPDIADAATQAIEQLTV